MVRGIKNKQKYFMSWRCEKCGEFGIQQVEQYARVVVFAEVTTTSAIDQWPHSSEHETIPDLINDPKDLSANVSTSMFT